MGNDNQFETDDSGLIGAPSVPYQVLKVIIPNGQIVTGVTINNITTQALTGTYYLYPIQHDLQDLRNYTLPTFVPPDASIYGSSSQYPANNIRSFGNKYEEGCYNICYIKLYLLQYIPSSGQVNVVTGVNFDIQTQNTYSLSPLQLRAKDSQNKKDNEIKEEVINPSDVDNYKVSPQVLVDKSSSYSYSQNGNDIFIPRIDVPVNPTFSSTSPGLFEYVIVTKKDFVPAFQQLANWRLKEGITTAIFTTEYIYSNSKYSGVQDYQAPTQSSQKIREFLKDMYRNCGTQYVLLGGDVDVVPTKYMNMSYPVFYPGPTDFYYCSGLQLVTLNGSPVELEWILQGNYADNPSVLGANTHYDCYEPAASTTSDPTLLPYWTINLNLGRADAINITEVQNFCSKTIAYEKNTHNDYFNKVLDTAIDPPGVSTQEFCQMGTKDISNGDVNQWNTWFPSYLNINKVYNCDAQFVIDANNPGTVYNANAPDTLSNMKAYLNSGYNVVLVNNHGSGAVWCLDSQDTIISGTCSGGGPWMQEADAYGLNSNGRFSGVCLNSSCESGAFDFGASYATANNTSFSISENFIKSLNGGFVTFIGASRTLGSNFVTAYAQYVQNLFNYVSSHEDDYFYYTSGSLYTAGKNSFINSSIGELTLRGIARTGVLEMNMQGDPLIPIYSNNAGSFAVSWNCPNIINSNVSYDITVNVAGVSNARVCLYKEGDKFLVQETDSSGNAVFSGFTAQTGGTLYVTVTKHNYLPFEGSIQVKGNMTAGLNWLRSVQNSNGSWSYEDGQSSSQQTVALTGLAILALINDGVINTPGYDYEADTNVKNGLAYILTQRNLADGSIFNSAFVAPGELPVVYETSGAISALIAIRKLHVIKYGITIYDADIQNAYNYLSGVQCVGMTRDQVNYVQNPTVSGVWEPALYFGGFGYPRGVPENFPTGWADMSNSQFALLALRTVDSATNIDPGTLGHIDWLNSASNADALIFVDRSRNVPTNVPLPPYTDGGGNYKPYGTTDSGHWAQNRSYGTMSAASMWAYWCLGIPGTDSRLTNPTTGLVNWFANNLSVDQNPVTPVNATNPAMGYEWLYYYYLTMAKAFTMYGLSNVKTINGFTDWYDALQNKLLLTQNSDGSWPNYITDPTVDWQEPKVMGTIFSLLSLQTRQPVWGGVLDVELFSPADLSITDVKGRVINVNTDQIPGALFKTQPHQRILIPSPAGAYKIKLVGSGGGGSYTLTVKGTLNGINYDNIQLTGTIAQGQEIGYGAVVNNIRGPFNIDIAAPPITPTFTITLTSTKTASPTFTITPTETYTNTPTPTCTVTPTITNTEIPGLCYKLRYIPGIDKIKTKTINPQIIFKNCSKKDVDLSSVVIRYFYTSDGYNGQETTGVYWALKSGYIDMDDMDGNWEFGKDNNENFGGEECGWFGQGKDNENEKHKISNCVIVNVIKNPFDCQDRILEISFSDCAGELKRGGEITLSVFVKRADNSLYDQSNDYSFGNCENWNRWENHEYWNECKNKGWRDWEKICVYDGGYLIRGIEPTCPTTITPTVTPTKVKQLCDSNIDKTPGLAEPLCEKNTFNFPNPCKDKTNIRFSLESPEDVNIAIYDNNGKIIWQKKLDAGETMAGVNCIVWNVTNDFGIHVANGVYILRVQAGEKMATKKIAIIR